jgi:hypothetical protein
MCRQGGGGVAPIKSREGAPCRVCVGLRWSVRVGKRCKWLIVKTLHTFSNPFLIRKGQRSPTNALIRDGVPIECRKVSKDGRQRNGGVPNPIDLDSFAAA